jgi:hypothetical protein
MPAENLMPPPPEPATSAEQKQEAFDAVVPWLLDNYGLLVVGEKRGAGLIVPLRTRIATATALTAFRTKLLPYRIIIGKTKFTPLDQWLTRPDRVEAAGFRTAPDKPWPTFTENGATYVNLYLRPELPEDGDASLGHEFLNVLLPDERERTWFKQWLGHKLRHPEVPGPSIVMVAQDTYGVGRGTLFKILAALFGHEYIARPDFDDVIGQGGQAVYNEWMATAILAFVNETSSEEDHRYTIRQKAYERLKERVDTSRQVRRIKGKYEKLYDTECGPGFIFASNLNTPLVIADKDRRLTFLRNGPEQAPEFYVKLNAWRAVPGNLSAFRRDLEAIDLTGFNAYAPLPTTLRDIVAEDGRSVIDEAVDLALETLPGEIVVPVQVVEAIEILRVRQGLYLRGEWQALAVRETKKRGRRIGVKHGPNWRPCLPQRGHRAAAYARSEKARERWTATDPANVLAELQKNEAAIAKLRKAAGRFPAFETIGGLATGFGVAENDNDIAHKGRSGRPPTGSAMSNAEHQKRWRDRQKGKPKPEEA